MTRGAQSKPSGAAPSAAPTGLVMLCDVDLDTPDATRTHTVEVARNFALEGLDVDLIARGGEPAIAGVRYHQAHGTETQHLRRVASVNVRSFLVLWRCRPSATRFYVRHQWSNVPAMLAARLLGYRVVTQVDDVQYGRGYERDIGLVSDHVKRLTAVLMGRLAQGIVAVTPQIKALLIDQFRVPAKRITVLPNGVDVDSIRPIPRSEAIRRVGLDPEARYLLFCGRFAPWVDFDMLLEAFALVRSRHRDVRLLLVGDGPERERIEQRAKMLEVRDAIDMTGFVEDRASVRDFMGAAVLALTSHSSGYVGRIGVSPTKLAEYLAAGRAVVAKDVPGMRETLEETGAGVVVPGDPHAMAEAIVALLDPARADELGAIGRRVAEERYTWRSVVQRTVPLFGDVDQTARHLLRETPE
jgi:glycosyltransferase involved in cell wall biosynthesis